MARVITLPFPSGDEPVLYKLTPTDGKRPRKAWLQCVEGDERQWIGILMTTSGHVRIDGSVQRLGQDDWHPADWVWDKLAATWRAPNMRWDAEKGEMVPLPGAPVAVRTEKAVVDAQPPSDSPADEVRQALGPLPTPSAFDDIPPADPATLADVLGLPPIPAAPSLDDDLPPAPPA